MKTDCQTPPRGIYRSPELVSIEIRLERGFAASSKWDDVMNGTDDVWLDKGETDDEWA